MTWLNLYISKFRAEPFVSATHEQRGVWLALIAYCCEQENGGNIHCADKWTARQWLVNVGIEIEFAQSESPLWNLNSFGTLNVRAFPAEKQAEVISKRAAAQRTNQQKLARRKNAQRDAQRDAQRNAQRDAQRDAGGGVEEEEEGNRNEKRNNINGAHAHNSKHARRSQATNQRNGEHEGLSSAEAEMGRAKSQSAKTNSETSTQ